MTTDEAVRNRIQEMVDRIVREFGPDRIILFGSHARGEGGPDSDVDLLVVMPVKGSRRRKSWAPSSGRLRGKERCCMPDREQVVAVVRGWVARAEGDLKTAAHTLKLEADCPTETVCFHAQQAVEKYLKALLVLRGIDFPKTHDIEELMSLVPAADRPEIPADEQARLTDYATVMRYPGDYEPISLTEARRAVSMARRVRRTMRGLLPKDALSGRGR